MRITAFLGSGITVEFGGIMSNKMTKFVIKQKQDNPDKNKVRGGKFFLRKIYKELNKFYGNETCNFEEIFYVLEMLNSLKTGYGEKTVKNYKPPIGAFIKLLKPFDSENFLIYRAQHQLIDTVANKINEYDSKFGKSKNDKNFIDFWNKATSKVHWDILTLNYDTCLEKSIINYEDGFEKKPETTISDINVYRFNPIKLENNDASKIMHVHGCILYGYPHLKNVNKYAYEDLWEDIYKFETYEKAKDSWYGRSTNTAQSHEEAIIGPLITGLRKTDKLIAYPYSSYYYEFQKSILENSSLFIAGYSFGDLHFNALISRMGQIHGDKRRIVIVTYIDDKLRHDWIPDINIMNWPDSDTYQVIGRLFQEDRFFPFRLPTDGTIVSSDKCVRLYLFGFKDAIENHGDEIINFLNS